MIMANTSATTARAVTTTAATAVATSTSTAGATRIKPEFWDEACKVLMKRDRILRRLIPLHGREHLHVTGAPFITLAQAIVGQQISVKAATAIWQRFVAVCGRRVSPASVLKLTGEQLRAVGFSKSKSTYVLDLASHFAQHKVKPGGWTTMDDDAIITELCAIRGIGRWTAEMFLIFSLGRADVLPLDDLGLMKAISLHYFSGEPVSRFEAREVAQTWAPWRTVATWHLWRSMDGAAVQYGTT